MPTFGLVVEGDYDAAAVPVFIRRYINGARVITRKSRGSVTGRLPGFLAELRLHKPDRVLVIRDADGHDPLELIEAMKRRVPAAFPISVFPLVAVQMIEAWLLADLSALGINRAHNRSVSPEKISDPKKQIKILLGPRDYTDRVAQSIAEKADLKILEARCPSFKKFREAVFGS